MISNDEFYETKNQYFCENSVKFYFLSIIKINYLKLIKRADYKSAPYMGCKINEIRILLFDKFLG